MAYEIKDNSGSLFANKKKDTDKHPDRTGTAKIDGVEYYVSGWVKQDRNGNPWMSLAFKRKDPMPAAKTDGHSVQPRGASRDPDDQIPFAPEWR